MTDSEDRGAFILYELMTPDPAGSKAFYDAVIGWDIDTASAVPGEVDYRMIKRSDGSHAGGMLTLSDQMIAGGARPGWFGYVNVPDVDAALAQVTAAGGAIHIGPNDMPGVGRMAMVTDPWGATLYLMTPAPPPDRPDARSDVFDYEKAQHFRWNELQSDDPEGALALFGTLFGWQKTGAMPMGDLGDYTFIGRAPEDMIGAVMKRMPQTPQSAWTYHIGVEDIDRAAKSVIDGGGTIHQGPDEIPGGEFSLTGTDPQGAIFGLVGPRHGAG